MYISCKYCKGNMIKDDRYINTYICLQCGTICEVMPYSQPTAHILWSKNKLQIKESPEVQTKLV